MTAEERLDRIENTLVEVVTIQRKQVVAIDQLTETTGLLTQAVSRYIDSAEGRMMRLEENLDGLIRALTAERTNGKTKN